MSFHHLIGIVVPAYNASRFIEALVSSIKEQSVNWRCVIVDDGSTDDTFEKASKLVDGDSRFSVITIENSGPAGARNVGYNALDPKCDFITFMDADDVYLPSGLLKLGECLEGIDKEFVGVHGLAKFIDINGLRDTQGEFERLGRSRRITHGLSTKILSPDAPSTFESIVTCSVIFPPGVILVRRVAYEGIRTASVLFNPERHKAEDWDVLIRLARLGNFKAIDEVVVGYRRHDQNLGASPGVGAACVRMLRANYYAPTNTPSHRQAIRRAWRSACMGACAHRVRQLGVALKKRQLKHASVLIAKIACELIKCCWSRPTLFPQTLWHVKD